MTDHGQNGKPDWVCQALDRFEGPLVRYAHRITKDSEQARDVVQETFLRLCRERREQLDGHLAEWLFTVCRNTALDVLRKESRMSTLAEQTVVGSASHEPEPSAVAEQQESAGRLMWQLEQLPEPQQEVLRLKFQNGLSYREIGGVTGHSVSHVGVLLHEGLKTLRHKLKDNI